MCSSKTQSVFLAVVGVKKTRIGRSLNPPERDSFPIWLFVGTISHAATKADTVLGISLEVIVNYNNVYVGYSLRLFETETFEIFLNNALVTWLKYTAKLVSAMIMFLAESFALVG